MKFLIDNALSPRLSDLLKEAGFDSIHIQDLGMQADTDTKVLQRALDEGRILISADTDFGTLLALSGKVSPIVIIFRMKVKRTPAEKFSALASSLNRLKSALDAGSLAIISDLGIRTRSLPIMTERE